MNNTIHAAFVAAQKDFGPALKTATNPHFKSRYADLAACIEAVIDGLHAHGLALIQRTHASETGVTVETVFIHESGAEMSGGELHVPAIKSDPQGYGSALTYARRYSLCAACGIAPEDDDGNAASKSKPDRKVEPEATLTVHASVEIEVVTEKTGESNGKKWTAFFVTFDGKVAGTFSATLASQALDAKDNGRLVNVTTKPGHSAGKLELVSITAANIN